MSTDRSPARIGIAERTDAKGHTQYRGTAYDKRAKRHLKGPWTPHLAEARAWRVDAQAKLQAGTLSAAKGPTIREAADKFLSGIESAAIRNRTGRPYKPSAIAGLPGRVPASDSAGARSFTARAAHPCRCSGVGRLIGRRRLAPNTIRNAVTPLQALYGWALSVGLAHVNPCTDLRLPNGERARDRIATRSEAAKLIAALPAKDQAALGLAVYAGLRMSELIAITWEAIDLEALTLRVTRAWDEKSKQFLSPKSEAGQDRLVPIVAPLATLLGDHAVLMNHSSAGLLFPCAWDASRPLSPGGLRNRATKAWRDSGQGPLGFHEGRHTCASVMIAAA